MNLSSFFSGPDHRAEDPVLVRVENEEVNDIVVTNPEKDRYNELAKKLIQGDLDDDEWTEIKNLKKILKIADN